MDTWLGRHGRLVIIAIALAYLFVNAAPVLVVENFTDITFPLMSMKLAHALFDGWSVRASLANAAIVPANAALIYPPGIYLLVLALGTVRNIYIFSLLWQMLSPLLLYCLARRMLRPLSSLVLALLSVCFLVQAQKWSPDYIAQPLILSIFLLLGVGKPQPARLSHLLLAALLNGLVFILKHNIGLFLLLASGLWIFFGALRERGGTRWPLAIVIMGCLAFSVMFLRRLVHLDEMVFYILPFLALWGSFALYSLRNCELGLSLRGFLAPGGLYLLTALVLPVCAFLFMGATVGYGRYLYSLFGMGFAYIHIWDVGVAGTILHYARGDSGAAVFKTVTTSLLFAGPFICTTVGAAEAIRRTALDRRCPPETWGMLAIPAMLAFSVFPLEGIQNAAPKLGVMLCLVLATLPPWTATRLRPVVILAALSIALPVAANAAVHYLRLARMPIAHGSEPVRRVIGMPLAKPLGDEITKQVALLNATIGNQSYEAIASEEIMTGVTALSPQNPVQFYVELREGLDDQPTVNAVLEEMRGRRFVIMEPERYAYFRGTGADAPMASVVRVLDREFAPVARYSAPPGNTIGLSSMLIFKRK